MAFLTTRGSVYEGSHLEMGSRYLQAMAEFFGIGRYDCVAADGLDAAGHDRRPFSAQPASRQRSWPGSFNVI